MEAKKAERGKVYFDYDSDGVITFYSFLHSSLVGFGKDIDSNFNLYPHFVNNCEIIF